jgi:ComF family protein
MEPSMNNHPFRSVYDNALRRGGRVLADGLIHFFFPRICPLCGEGHQIDEPLCRGCAKKLSVSRSPLMQTDPADFGHLRGPIHFDGAATCWNFSTDIEALVHRVKYTGAPKLGLYLGGLAAESLVGVLSFPEAVVTPVPLHPVRHRERGFNQSDAIGRGVASRLNLSYADDVLVRKKHTQTQTKLSAEARQENVENAFVLSRRAQALARSFVVVDDVITTGATLNACARALKTAGAERVIGLALARPRM